MWQIGDRLQHSRKPEVLYKVIGVGEDTYLLITKPISIKIVLSKFEAETKEWTKYKGESSNGIKKNPVKNNGKGSKKSRKTKAGDTLQKSVDAKPDRRTVGNAEVNGGRPPLHRKSRARKRWKRKKKGFSNPHQHNTGKDL